MYEVEISNEQKSLPANSRRSVSIVIPTFGRDQVLVETIAYLCKLGERADEILVIDQTPRHDPATDLALAAWVQTGAIRWIRPAFPSITHAMNQGLLSATGDIVLFVDDDIVPKSELVREHRLAFDSKSLNSGTVAIVAGRVLQPWHVDGRLPFDRLASECEGFVDEFIGCNFSVDRRRALDLGGFDENFVRVAYRYEAEFGDRAKRAGFRIKFQPGACLHHLRSQRGGTRSFGDHLRTLTPAHAVGHYYYLLRSRPPNWKSRFVVGPMRAIATRFHLRHPWWIPAVLCGHVAGAIWACILHMRGAKLVTSP